MYRKEDNFLQNYALYYNLDLLNSAVLPSTKNVSRDVQVEFQVLVLDLVKLQKATQPWYSLLSTPSSANARLCHDS